MSNVAAEIFTDDNMPCCAVSSVELLLDVSCDVLLDIIFLEGGIGDVDGLLLELFAHVNIFYDSFGTCGDTDAGTSICGGGNVWFSFSHCVD